MITADPERAIAILEEGANEHAAEAVRISWIVNEHFEVVAVVPVQPILRAKPHEALIVLHNLSNLCLRQPVGCGEACEPDVRPIDNGQPDLPGVHARLWYCALRDSPLGRAHLRNHGKEAQAKDGQQRAADARRRAECAAPAKLPNRNSATACVSHGGPSCVCMNPIYQND